MTVPDRTEAAEYYFTYINQVEGTDVVSVLDAQTAELISLAKGVSEEKSLHRYSPGKWSLRESLSHINDTERAFVFRALWFARGFDSPLPSYDQGIAVAHSFADSRSWASHVEEFRSIRAGTLTFFRSVADEAWSRRGVASGNPFTVRAMAFITAGHVAHHLKIMRERYL